MFHYVSCLPVFNKEIALKNVHILMVFTDSFIGPLHKIQNTRIQSCIYVKSICSYSSHAAFSYGLGDNSFSQVEKCVTKNTERQPPQLQIASTAHDKKKTEPEKYDNFMTTHECSINHVGSAGSIEASGLKGFFMTSVETNKLRYTNYIGEGSQNHTMIFSKLTLMKVLELIN